MKSRVSLSNFMKVTILRDDALKTEICDVCYVDKDRERFLISHTDPTSPKFNTFEWISIVYCCPYIEIERPNKIDVKILKELKTLADVIDRLNNSINAGFSSLIEKIGGESNG